MENFERVLDTLSYVALESTQSYVEKLCLDIAIPLLDEEILCTFRRLPQGGFMLFLTDLSQDYETHIITRDDYYGEDLFDDEE